MRPLATMLMLRCTAALVPRALPRVSTRLLSTQTDGVTGCVEIIYGAFVLNRRVDLHAIDATPAR